MGSRWYTLPVFVYRKKKNIITYVLQGGHELVLIFCISKFILLSRYFSQYLLIFIVRGGIPESIFIFLPLEIEFLLHKYYLNICIGNYSDK